jgi:hypothetical protein
VSNLFLQLRGAAAALQQVVVPGVHEVSFAEPGAYTIFHEQRAIVAGRYFASDRQLNGLKLRLQSQPGGQDISIDTPTAHTTYSFAEREGSSIATFEVKQPGMYRLSAWYPEPAYDTTAVLAIGHGVERRLMAGIFGSLAAGFVGVFGAGALAVATFVRRRNVPSRTTDQSRRSM